MRVCTRSNRIVKAIEWVLWRMPPNDRQVVERFVYRIAAARAWARGGLTGVDPTSATLAPFWKVSEDGVKCETLPTGELHCERTSNRYDAQMCFNLPILRLFSDKALVGIVAHEFAHARIAARLGEYWHEKMRVRAQAHERAADRLATSWGFGKSIDLMRKERDETVSAILYSREEEIRRVREAGIARGERGGRVPLDQ